MKETRHNEWFKPECIDEQIEQLTHESKDAHESRLVSDLWQMYTAEREEQQASERIHERLTRYLAGELSHGTHEEQRPADEGWSLQQGRKRPMEAQEPTVHKHAWTRQFAVFAAVLITILLVGSLIAALHIVRANSNAGGTATPHEQHQAQPEMYVSLITPQNNQLLKIDKQTGKVLWRFTVARASQDPSGPAKVPTVEDGTAYFATPTGKLYALDAQTGKQRWTQDFQTYIISQDMVNGILYVSIEPTDPAHQNRSVYALNPADGTIERIYDVSGWILGTSNGVMYIGSIESSGAPGHTLTAIDVTSGKQLWQTTFDPQQRLNGTISTRDNALYLSSLRIKEAIPNEPQDSYAYMLDIHTGKIIWQSPMMNGFVFNIAVDDNGRVYCGAQNNSVYAFDPNTNRQLWQYQMTEGNVYPAPIIQHGIVYVVPDSAIRHLVALDATTGTVKWVKPLDALDVHDDIEPLLLYNDVIYIPTREGISGFSTSSGDKVETVPLTTLLANGAETDPSMLFLAVTIA